MLLNSESENARRDDETIRAFEEYDSFYGNRLGVARMCPLDGAPHCYDSHCDGYYVCCKCGAQGPPRYEYTFDQQSLVSRRRWIQEVTGNEEPDKCVALLPSAPVDMRCSLCIIGSVRTKLRMVQLAIGFDRLVYNLLASKRDAYNSLLQFISQSYHAVSNVRTAIKGVLKGKGACGNSRVGDTHKSILLQTFQELNILQVSPNSLQQVVDNLTKPLRTKPIHFARLTRFSAMELACLMANVLQDIQQRTCLPHQPSFAILCKWKARESTAEAAAAPEWFDADEKLSEHLKQRTHCKLARYMQTFAERFMSSLKDVDESAYSKIERNCDVGNLTKVVDTLYKKLQRDQEATDDSFGDLCPTLLHQRHPNNNMRWICGCESCCCSEDAHDTSLLSKGRAVCQDDKQLWNFQFGLTGVVALKLSMNSSSSPDDSIVIMQRAASEAGNAFWNSKWVLSRVHAAATAASVLAHRDGFFHNSLPLHPQMQLSVLSMASILGVFKTAVAPLFDSLLTPSIFAASLTDAFKHHTDTKGNAVVDSIVALRLVQYKFFVESHCNHRAGLKVLTTKQRHIVTQYNVPFLPNAFGQQRNSDEFKEMIEKTFLSSYEKAVYDVKYTTEDFSKVCSDVMHGWVCNSTSGTLQNIASHVEHARHNRDGRLFGKDDLKFDAPQFDDRITNAATRIASVYPLVFDPFRRISITLDLEQPSLVSGLFLELMSVTSRTKKAYKRIGPDVKMHAFASALQSQEHQDSASALKTNAAVTTAQRLTTEASADFQMETIEDCLANLVIGKRTDKFVNPNILKPEQHSTKLTVKEEAVLQLSSEGRRRDVTNAVRLILSPGPIDHLCLMLCDIARSTSAAHDANASAPPSPKRTTAVVFRQCRLSLTAFGEEFFEFLSAFSGLGIVNVDVSNQKEYKQVASKARSRFDDPANITDIEWERIASIAVLCSCFYGNMTRASTMSVSANSNTECMLAMPFLRPHSILLNAYSHVNGLVTRLSSQLKARQDADRARKILVDQTIFNTQNDEMEMRQKNAFSVLNKTDLARHVANSATFPAAASNGYDSFVACGIMKFVFECADDAFEIFKQGCSDNAEVLFKLLQELLIISSSGGYGIWLEQSNSFSRMRPVVRFLILVGDAHGTTLEKHAARLLDSSGFCFTTFRLKCFEPLLSRAHPPTLFTPPPPASSSAADSFDFMPTETDDTAMLDAPLPGEEEETLESENDDLMLGGAVKRSQKIERLVARHRNAEAAAEEEEDSKTAEEDSEAFLQIFGR